MTLVQCLKAVSWAAFGAGAYYTASGLHRIGRALTEGGNRCMNHADRYLPAPTYIKVAGRTHV